MNGHEECIRNISNLELCMIEDGLLKYAWMIKDKEDYEILYKLIEKIQKEIKNRGKNIE